MRALVCVNVPDHDTELEGTTLMCKCVMSTICHIQKVLLDCKRATLV